MSNDENKKEDYGSYEENRKTSQKIHNELKKIDFNKIVERLKKHGFKNPEELAKSLLEDKE